MAFSRITSVVEEHPCTTSSASIVEGRGTRGEREGGCSNLKSPIPIPSSSTEFVAIEAKRRGEEEEDGKEGGNEENPGSLIHFVESAAESGNIF